MDDPCLARAREPGRRRDRTRWVQAFPVAILVVLPAALPAGAEDRPLSELTIEELLSVQVFSAVKRPQALRDAPAALYVIGPRDLLETGHRSIPEALRLAPGLHVARLDASTWGITARGLNDRWNSRTLILVDGRSVYEPSFGGASWLEVDYVLDDLESIEVIRGPGGSLWGANAVHGVINVNTKSARDTQGWLLRVGGGTEERAFADLRFGGQGGDDLWYRIYTKVTATDGSVRLDGSDRPDDWHNVRPGFRVDWEPGPDDRVRVTGEVSVPDVDTENLLPVLDPEIVLRGERGVPVNDVLDADIDEATWHLDVRWTRTFSPTSEGNLQVSYYAVDALWDDVLDIKRHTLDVDTDHGFELVSSLDLIWGARWRITADEVVPLPRNRFVPGADTQHLVTGFLQLSWEAIEDRLWLVTGTKVEHNEFTGFEHQPNVRAVVRPADRHTVWLAGSRAVRTPSRLENGIEAVFGTAPCPGDLPLPIPCRGPRGG